MGVVGKALAHDSATLHVCGKAPYVDDINELNGTLHVAVGLSERAHADIVEMDLSAVKASAGVAYVITAADLKHSNDIGPVLPGDPLLADGIVEHVGQPIFAVAATTRNAARQAAKLAHIRYQDKPAVLSIAQALNEKQFIIPEESFHRLRRGDAAAAIAASAIQLSGEITIGGQEHFYLESQAAYAIPQENRGMLIHSSSQNPNEIQLLAAEILGVRMHEVTVLVRRMGGAFGGKETQATLPACIAAVIAQQTGRPTKYRPSRADDFRMTGKRHPFWVRYKVGADNDGMLKGVEITLAADCGMSADLSLAVVDRAMFHADNAYYYPTADITGIPCKTNFASNTAFRGFGGPQGMLVAEKIMQIVAAACGKDGFAVRRQNLYQTTRNTTPYGQTVNDDILPALMDFVGDSADYNRRQQDIQTFNDTHRFLKKGLAITPVKFGISFTKDFLNQAGALLTVYQDGTVLINHGGTEMGQGLFIKIMQIVADELGIPLTAVRCSTTDTSKVPNASPTAASASADLNGMAAAQAARTLVARMRQLAGKLHDCDDDAVRFVDGEVFVGKQRVMSFADLSRYAHAQRVSLSATGYYRTPKIYYDRNSRSGRPYFYYANGVAASEVLIDTLTGEHRLLRVDIIYDTGCSLNPAIDIGQIEGGFAQGVGWLTTEELSWNASGALQTVGPATYKIPAIGDMPTDFRIHLHNHANTEHTIHRSKAVGEPPLMLALSVWAALSNAASAAANRPITLQPPVTPERLLNSINTARLTQNISLSD